jgi:hypothetical protein
MHRFDKFNRPSVIEIVDLFGDQQTRIFLFGKFVLIVNPLMLCVAIIPSAHEHAPVHAAPADELGQRDRHGLGRINLLRSGVRSTFA